MFIFPERKRGRTLSRSWRHGNRDPFRKNESKIHEGGCVKEFFFHKRTGWYVTTSIEINSFADNFQEFQPNKHLRMDTFRS